MDGQVDADTNSSIAIIQNFNPVNPDFPALTHAFRTLRNLCANGKHYQTVISKYADSLLPKAHQILVNCLKKSAWDETEELCRCIVLQFLANYIVGNIENQQYVWTLCGTTIRACLSSGSNKTRTASTMILYNMLLCHKKIYERNEDSFSDVVKLCLNEDTSEFALYVLELLISQSEYISKWYGRLEVEDRLVLLGVLCNMAEEKKTLPSTVFGALVDFFHGHCECVLGTAAGEGLLGAQEVVRMLEFFNKACGNQELLAELQKYELLLIDAVNLLRSVHEVSKETGNNFSMLRKIADLLGTSVDEQHPSFGFKCALIRLIGNLCYKNKANQDRIRGLDGILLILDCSSIDGRNPLVIQWVILAMRNICEDNIDNQRVVASVGERSVVDVASLAELGIRLHANADGSGVGIAPLTAFKK